MGHYFTNELDLKSNQKLHQVTIKNRVFNFLTDHGVFSKKNLDFGTQFLIETLIETNYDRVLDLGCGYGPIGVILKSFNPLSKVDLVDVNERALELTKHNARINQQEVNVFLSDGFKSVTDQYDLIATNPPIRAGKAIIYGFFADAKNHLTEDGSLFIVIQKKQGALSAIKFCETIYTKVMVVEKKSGYLIIKCGL